METAPGNGGSDFRITPSMVPFDPTGASAIDMGPFVAGMPSFLPHAQNQFAYPLSYYTPQFLGSASPYQIPLLGPLPSTTASTEVGAGSSVHDNSHSRVQHMSPTAYTTHASRRAMWPNYAPGNAMPTSTTHSRLPAHNVARKAPRKSSTSSYGQDSSSNPSHDRSKATRRRTGKLHHRQKHEACSNAEKHSTSVEDSTSIKHSTSAEDSTSIKDLTALKDPTALERQRIVSSSSAAKEPVTPSDKDESEDDDDDLPLRERFEKGNAFTPAPKTQTRRKTRVNKATHAVQTRSQPLYKYRVPDELKGLRKALGEDNWNDYVVLTEKKLLGEIADAAFAAQSNKIFMVYDDKIKKSIERQVANKVVLPGIPLEKRKEKR